MDVPFVKLKDKGTPIDNLGNYDSKGESIVFICSAEMMAGRKLLFTTQNGMMKLVDGSEFSVTKRTVAATKLGDDDLVVSVEITEAMEKPEFADVTPDNGPVMLTGGFDDDSMGGFSDMDMMGDSFDMTFDDLLVNDQVTDNKANDNSDENIVSNQIVVLQTKKGMFLRFPLREIPEKKKGAIGIKGIKLADDDIVEKVYLMDAGDNMVVEFKGKEIELRKLKTTKHGAKGTRKS